MLKYNKTYFLKLLALVFIGMHVKAILASETRGEFVDIPLNNDDQTAQEDEKSRDECSICLLSLDKESSRLHCGHLFHENCLRSYVLTQWRKKQSSGESSREQYNCPLCRSQISVQSRRVYVGKRENCFSLFYCMQGERVKDETELLISLKGGAYASYKFNSKLSLRRN